MTTVSMLTCPLCGQEQDPAGPGVASHQQRDTADGSWTSTWVPFIEDLRGTPQRLVHPKCFADESGFDELMRVITAHDQRVRLEESRRFKEWLDRRPTGPTPRQQD